MDQVKSTEQELLTAVKEGNNAGIQELLSKGANVNAKTEDGKTPLMYMARSGDTTTVKTLLDKGADVNEKDKQGITALMLASYQGYTDIVQILLDKGADVKAKTKKGLTALMVAENKGHIKIIELFKHTKAGGQTESQIKEKKHELHHKDMMCFFCNDSIINHEPVRLSNSSYICEACFEKIRTIQYPQFYQKKYEKYISECAKRIDALKKFKESLIYTKFIKLLPIIIFIILGVFIISGLSIQDGKLLIIGIVVSGFAYYLARDVFENKQASAISSWGLMNSEPNFPILKGFYDPSVELTQYDKKVIGVLNYWPDYPPIWDYIRGIVLIRDKERCQISGCPSRTTLHVHHKIPISRGGSHQIENLVILCAFHHGLQPDTGHERIRGEIRTQYFSMVRAHYRNGSPVRTHPRRKELVSEKTLNEILSYYAIACSNCKEHPLNRRIDYQRNKIFISCPNCFSKWLFKQKLAEESGPRIADTLLVLKNAGHWKINFIPERNG